MKTYHVKVNGNLYEIEVEVVKEEEAKALQNNTLAAPTAPAPVAKQTTSSVATQKISAPMPGTILAVHAATGDLVQKGQVLIILEAMKMENEILAPRDGKVASVAVKTGAAVETGTLLCEIE